MWLSVLESARAYWPGGRGDGHETRQGSVQWGVPARGAWCPGRRRCWTNSNAPTIRLLARIAEWLARWILSSKTVIPGLYGVPAYPGE